MNHAIIDVGSNTIRFSVYECRGEEISTLVSKKTTAGLAGYVENGALSQAGIDRCIAVLALYRRILGHFDLASLNVFATASLRNIENTDEAVEQIRAATGLEVEVILGREEAELDFIGAARSMELSEGLLVDIGGGSTELVSYRGGSTLAAASVGLGSLRLYSDRVAALFPEKEERRAIRRAVEERLDALPEFEGFACREVCGVGGTIRGACKLYNYAAGAGPENRTLPVAELKELLHRFRNPDKRALQAILRTIPDRIHTILPGLIALRAIVERFGCETIHVSPFGAREGYLIDRVLNG